MAGRYRSQGLAPDPGAYEAQPLPGTLKLVDVRKVGNLLWLYHLSDRPVFINTDEDTSEVYYCDHEDPAKDFDDLERLFSSNIGNHLSDIVP